MSRSCPCLRPVVWSPLASLSPYKNGSHKVFIIQQTDPDHNVQGKPWHARILHVHSFVVFQLNKIQKYLAHFFTRILEMIGSRYISVITVFKNWSFVYESIFSNEISNRRQQFLLHSFFIYFMLPFLLPCELHPFKFTQSVPGEYI